jgi:hypothetical protein
LRHSTGQAVVSAAFSNGSALPPVPARDSVRGMEAPEYVVRVKAWPAYVLVVVAIVCVPLYGVVLPWVVLQGSSSMLVFLLVVMMLCGAVQIGAMLWAVRRVFVLVRHPPRLSAAGMKLWLLPTSTYVDVPWDRVAAVCTAVKGLGRGLFVYVYDPESLVGQDPSRLGRLRREMRRFFGAPFVYPLVTRGDRLGRIDTAVRHFSAGRLWLAEGAPAGIPGPA